MPRALISLVLAGYSMAALGETPIYDFKKPLDDGMTLVGMECHKKKETLELGYFDSSKPPVKRMDLWDVSLMVTVDPDKDRISSVSHVERNCNIASDKYRVRFTAVPGNHNIQGKCGASTYANAKVWKNGKVVFDQDLEECFGSAITRAVIFSRGSDIPQIRTEAQ